MGSIKTAVQRFVGMLLMAVGGLITTLCGLCTMSGMASSLVQSLRSGPGSGILVIVSGILLGFADVLLVSGLPLLFGLSLLFSGLKLTSAETHWDFGGAGSDIGSGNSLMAKGPRGAITNRAQGALVITAGMVIAAFFSFCALGVFSLDQSTILWYPPPEAFVTPHWVRPPPPPASLPSRITGGGFAVIGALIFLKGLRMIRARRMAAADDDVPGPILARPRVASEHPDDAGARREDP